VIAASEAESERNRDAARTHLLLMLVVVMKGCSNVQSLWCSSLKTRDVGRTNGGKSKGNVCRAVVETLSVVMAILVVDAMPRDDGTA